MNKGFWAKVYFVAIVAAISAGTFWGVALAGTVNFVDGGRGAYYEVPAASVPAIALGNVPSDSGYCPPEGYFNESSTRIWRTGNADITAVVQHGLYEPTSGTLGWQNATNAFTINGTGALINSTWLQTAANEMAACWRLSITAGATLTNAITNTSVVFRNGN